MTRVPDKEQGWLNSPTLLVFGNKRPGSVGEGSKTQAPPTASAGMPQEMVDFAIEEAYASGNLPWSRPGPSGPPTDPAKPS